MSVDRIRSIGSRNAGVSGVLFALLLSLTFVVSCEGGGGDAADSPAQVWPTGTLIAAEVLSGDAALVVSAAGQIFRTVDRGETWSRAHTPAGLTLSSISMVDDQVGWAAGPGVILRTENAGKSWTRQRLPGRAADHPIRSLAALDGARALALEDHGEWLATQNAGAIWLPVEQSEASVSLGDRSAVFTRVRCFETVLPRCYAIGQMLLVSADAGESWVPVSVADAAGLPEIEFRVGGVEPQPKEQAAIASAAAFLAAEPVWWKIDVSVSEVEIERYAKDRDPSALFELIEARGQEIRGRLEGAGVAAEAIEIEGAPPWGYEDYLDDDPDSLERYFRDRVGERPSVQIRAVRQTSWTDVAMTGDGAEILAIAEGGRVFAAFDDVPALAAVNAPGKHDLLAVQAGPRGWVAVGRQGGLWLGTSPPRAVDEAPEAVGQFSIDWQIPTVVGEAAFFETMRDVAASPDGMTLLAVGDEARLLWSDDGGASWRLLRPLPPADSSTAASVPITR